MTLSVGKVARMFEVSRTTLLYYDKIGLVSPSSRSAAGYRLYSRADVERLNQIIILKNAGVPIKQIKSLIAAEDTIAFGKLMKRLGELNLEIEKRKNYQKQIIGIMKEISTAKNLRSDAEIIGKVIRNAGIDWDKKEQWHSDFEKQSPELHEYFLSILGLTQEEMKILINKITS